MKFKVGDKVKVIKPATGLATGLAKDSVWIVAGCDWGGGYVSLQSHPYNKGCGFDWWDADRFELIEAPKMNTQLKKNWSIAVHQENAEVYKSVLIALGYTYTDDVHNSSDNEGVCAIRHSPNNCDEMNYFWFSYNHDAGNIFSNLESFLIWHYAPIQTEEELKRDNKIILLEETIKQASIQLQQLKAMAK